MSKEIRMIKIPAKADVYCADGIVGRTTYIIGNPINAEITHLVVQSLRPPFQQYLVPISQITRTTNSLIQLKCTRDALGQMQLFQYEEYIRTELPGYVLWEDVPAIPGLTTEPVTSFIPVRRQNIPVGELAVRCSARVEATDGYVGQVDELLINSKNMQITHFVLLERHIIQKKEITIPMSQVDQIDEDMIHLKLDRQSVEEMLTTLL